MTTENQHKFNSGRNHYWSHNNSHNVYEIWGSPKEIKNTILAKWGFTYQDVDYDYDTIEPVTIKEVIHENDTVKYKNMTKKQIIQMFMNEISYLEKRIKEESETKNAIWKNAIWNQSHPELTI